MYTRIRNSNERMNPNERMLSANLTDTDTDSNRAFSHVFNVSLFFWSLELQWTTVMSEVNC